MAVSMGLTVDFSDSVGYVNYADHDLTDIENDEDYAYTPTAFQPVLPRSCKRTYGVFLGSEVVLERKLRSRMHGQLEQLRAVIPNSFTVSTYECHSCVSLHLQKFWQKRNE